MSVPVPDSVLQFKFTPFYAIVSDGFDRMLDVVETEEFTFSVNGSSVKSNVAEAVLISPKIHDLILNDRSIRSFVICDEKIKVEQIEKFLSFVRFRNCQSFLRDDAHSFLSLCRLFGNERLSVVFLTSIGSISSEMKVAESKIDFVESDIDVCSSQFYRYSKDDIEMIEKATLHKLLESTSLQIETEDSLLRLLIDLGGAYFEFWNYIEVSLLSSDGISLFVEQLPFDFVTETIWSKVVLRLKGDFDSNDHNQRHRTVIPVIPSVPFTSTILTEIPSVLCEFEKKRWTLHYRGTRDGFKASTFHEKIDGRVNTVTIIETTKGYIFGGFARIGWDSRSSWKCDDSRASFLFTIRNPHNISSRKFSLSNPSDAIYCPASYGPTFGGNHDIHVADNSNTNTSSYSNLGHGYENDTGVNGRQIFTGEYNFTVKEIEVFTIED
jgi:hypothetical protein